MQNISPSALNSSTDFVLPLVGATAEQWTAWGNLPASTFLRSSLWSACSHTPSSRAVWAGDGEQNHEEGAKLSPIK